MSKELAASGQLSAEQVGDRLRLWKRLREQRDACADALRAIDPTNSALVGIPTRTQQLENILNACEDEKQLSPPPNEKQVSSFHESLHQSTMALRGTFADGTEEICPQDLVEAYAIPMDTNGHPQPPVHLMAVELLKYRALAQGQRESNSNPAPVHGQSKTGLTGSHPGAPTHQRSEALGTGATSPKERNASASSDHPSRTDRQEPSGLRYTATVLWDGKTTVHHGVYPDRQEPVLSAEQMEAQLDANDAPSPKYAEHIRFEGRDCVVLSPEGYEYLYAMALRSLTARDEGIEAAAKVLRKKYDELAVRSYPAPTILLTMAEAIEYLKGASHD